jgi:hypothetical protein
MSYSVQYRRELVSLANMLEKQSEMLKSIGSRRDNLYDKLLFDGLSLLSHLMSRLHHTTVNQLQDLNILFDTIEKLPKSKEVDKLKEELEQVKTSDREIKLSVEDEIKEALQEFLKALKRAKKGQGQRIQ